MAAIEVANRNVGWKRERIKQFPKLSIHRNEYTINARFVVIHFFLLLPSNVRYYFCISIQYWENVTFFWNDFFFISSIDVRGAQTPVIVSSHHAQIHSTLRCCNIAFHFLFPRAAAVAVASGLSNLLIWLIECSRNGNKGKEDETMREYSNGFMLIQLNVLQNTKSKCNVCAMRM